MNLSSNSYFTKKFLVEIAKTLSDSNVDFNRLIEESNSKFIPYIQSCYTVKVNVDLFSRPVSNGVWKRDRTRSLFISMTL